MEPGATRQLSPPFIRRSDSSPESNSFRRNSATSTSGGGRHFSTDGFGAGNGFDSSPTSSVGRRSGPPPPNVTVVQGVPTFGPHAASPSTSSILSYLYQSGLHPQTPTSMPPGPPPPLPSHHHSVPDGPSYHHGHQHHLPSSFPSLPPSAMSQLPPFSAVPPGLSGNTGDVPFPFPPTSGDPAAGLVQAAAAAAAAAAGLHHLNPAALMLSAAGQLAAVHPWLYPSYLAAAAFGQTAAAAAAASALQQHPSVPNPASSFRPESRRSHHHHHHHGGAGNSPTSSSTSSSSSSRYAPYPTSGIGRRRAESPSAVASLVPMTSSSSGPSAAASPPAAPDTTDSPGVGGCNGGSGTTGRQSPEQPESPLPGLPRPSSASSSSEYSLRTSRSRTGNGNNSEELRNIEQMVNGLERTSSKTSKIVVESTPIDDHITETSQAQRHADQSTMMDVDSSRC